MGMTMILISDEEIKAKSSAFLPVICHQQPRSYLSHFVCMSPSACNSDKGLYIYAQHEPHRVSRSDNVCWFLSFRNCIVYVDMFSNPCTHWNLSSEELSWCRYHEKFNRPPCLNPKTGTGTNPTFWM